MSRLIKVLFAIFLLPLSHSTLAQSAGSTASSLTGVVADAQGGVIPGASVTARNTATNSTREAQSGEDGSFLMAQLSPGSYEVTVKAEGFTAKASRVDLVLGTTTLLNFSLEVGAGAEIVLVIGNNKIDEGKTESSTNIDRGRIDNLPINRRNFMDFSLTAPRVTADRLPPLGSTATSGVSFNGQTARGNNITIDGLTNNDNFSSGVRTTFSQDAVQEFQVVSDSYSAEFGRAIGGVLNIITRGGTNDVHGSLFNYLRNDRISARDTFSPIEPEFKQYQFGGTFSGPIKRDKAFFFTSFERLSVKQNLIVTIDDPTVASARRLGYPVRNGPIPFAVATTSVLARMDADLTPNDKLAVRYNGGFRYDGAFENFGPTLGGLSSETTSGVQRLDDNTVTASNTYISQSLNLINETRFLYGRRKLDLSPIDPNDSLAQLVTSQGQVAFGINVVLPQFREDRIYQIVDNVSLSRGRHQVKFGIDFNYINTPGNKSFLPLAPGGLTFFVPFDFASLFGTPGLPFFSSLENFDPSLRSPEQREFLNSLSDTFANTIPGFPKGVPLADLSLPQVFIQGFGDPRLVIDSKLFTVFVQDDIKLRPNLLVKAGLRYDLNRVKFMPEDNINFSPRVALSYRPGRFPGLNLRAAYGIFHGTPPLVLSFAAQQFKKEDSPSTFAFIPFPFSVFPFSMPGHRFPISTQLPPTVTPVPQFNRIIDFAPDFREGYTHQATLGIDYFIGNNSALSFSYAFVRGVKILGARNINPVVRPIPGDPLTSQLIGRVDTTRGDIIEFESAFDSYYHAFTALYNRRLSNRFGLLASYTLAKSIDDFIDLRNDQLAVQDSLNISGERSLSLQDVRQRFVFSGIWELSYTRNPLLRDFQLSTIVSLESGSPYNLIAGVDLNMDANTPIGDRPLGLGRNAGIKPGFASVDLRISRTASIGERFRIQGFFEIFNLFNRVNISQVDNVFPPDAAGNFNLPPKEDKRFIAPKERYRNAFAPRQCQFGIRFTF